MNSSEHILKNLSRREWRSSSLVRERMADAPSRVYVTKLLKELVAEGKVEKRGHTRGAMYRLATPHTFTRTYQNIDLEEHVVEQHIEDAIPALSTLDENVHSIFVYAFSEMMNNAIEHSRSKHITVHVEVQQAIISCTIEDAGIGVFRNVRDTRKLESETEAALEILKGKTTTMPRSHSGEGIFFTSKVVQRFELTSYGHVLRCDNELPDTFVGEVREVTAGTMVQFTIDTNTDTHLNEVFMKYTNIDKTSDFGFDRTEIHVKLYAVGGVFVSRSQARRILSGLDQFTSIVLDFDKVPMVGQAFVDEVFRVFQHAHPAITLTPIHMNEAVRFMVERGRGDDRGK